MEELDSRGRPITDAWVIYWPAPQPASKPPLH